VELANLMLQIQLFSGFADAVSRGLYGVWMPTPPQIGMLSAIFPQGVCDYSQPDAGLPPGW
jgi:hypothetical protein